MISRQGPWAVVATLVLVVGCGGGGGGSEEVAPPVLAATVVYSAGAVDTPVLYAAGRSGALPGSDAGVRRWVLAADGQAVVALAADGRTLRHLPLGAGQPRDLTPALAAGRSVSDFQLRPDGAEVAYVADADSAGVPEVFVAPVAAGAAAAERVGPAAAGAAMHGLPPAAWSPDGRHLLLARRSASVLAIDLHDRGSGATTALFERPAADAMLEAQWSPDAVHWIVRSRVSDELAVRHRVYVADIGTTGVEKVNGGTDSTDPTYHDCGPFQAFPDGSGLVYSGGFFGSLPRQALRTGVWGALSSSVSSYGFPRVGSRVLDLALTPDAGHLAYLADEVDGVVQLFRRSWLVDQAGVRMNAVLPAGRHVLAMALSADGAQLLYITSSAADTVRDGELYRVAMNAPGVAERLGATGAGTLDVRQARFLPDGSGAVVLAEGGDAGVAALYHVAFAMPERAWRISGAAPAGQGVRAFDLR